MDAERAGKVINPGVLIGKSVISGGGSAGDCWRRGGAPVLSPIPARPPLPVPSGKVAIKNRSEGEKSNKTGPGWEPDRHREAQGWVGLAGGHPWVPPLPSHCSPSSPRLRQPRSRLQPY